METGIMLLILNNKKIAIGTDSVKGSHLKNLARIPGACPGVENTYVKLITQLLGIGCICYVLVFFGMGYDYPISPILRNFKGWTSMSNPFRE